MMKPSDISTAIALLIQGYLRANGDNHDNLTQCLAAIESECSDWAENLSPVSDEQMAQDKADGLIE